MERHELLALMMEAQLETMVAAWTSTLHSNLEDPITQDNMKLLKSDDRYLEVL